MFDSRTRLREILKEAEICDYEEMSHGKENGTMHPITVVTEQGTQPATISLYRSNKRGDRRFSISGLKEFAETDDTMVIYFNEKEKSLVAEIIPQKIPLEEELESIDEYPLPENEDDEIDILTVKIDYNKETIGSLLNGNAVYVMPRFQRFYTWDKGNFDQLWQDIDEIWKRDEDIQFLGALLTNIHKASWGSQAGQNWVIDGQQRITTLYMLMCAITKVAQDAGFTDRAESFAAPLSISLGGDLANRPTIRPTIQDTKSFNKMLRRIKSSTPKMVLYEDRGKRPRIHNMWTKWMITGVKKRVTDGQGDVQEDRLEFLYDIVKNRLAFIMIDIPSEMNPYKVYERLNNSGKPLTAGDLVRNLIFGKLMDSPEAAEALHEEKMVPYEQEFLYEKDGKTKSKLDDYYLPFSLTRPINKITKATMFRELRSYWKGKTSEAIIAELQKYVPVFIAVEPDFPEEKILPDIGEEKDPLKNNQKIYDRILRLRRLKPPTTTYPYLMQLLQYYREKSNMQKEICKCLDIFESYLVRRNICSLQNAGFTNFFRGMWKDGGGEPNPKHLLKQLQETSGYEYPDDESVGKHITTTNLYSKRALCKFILNEYELVGAQSGHMEYVLDNYKSSTIEHIIPQEYDQWVEDMRKWNFDEGVGYSGWHAANVDTIGNLTILMSYENSEIGNNPWKDKRKYYLKTAKYRRIKEIAEAYEEYDNSSHDTCTETIRQWIIERWPREFTFK